MIGLTQQSDNDIRPADPNLDKTLNDPPPTRDELIDRLEAIDDIKKKERQVAQLEREYKSKSSTSEDSLKRIADSLEVIASIMTKWTEYKPTKPKSNVSGGQFRTLTLPANNENGEV